MIGYKRRLCILCDEGVGFSEGNPCDACSVEADNAHKMHTHLTTNPGDATHSEPNPQQNRPKYAEPPPPPPTKKHL